MQEVFQSIIDYMTFGHIVNFIYVLNFIIALVIIFVDKKSPVATLAWISILFLVPAIGLFGYLVFSQHISRLKVDRMTDEEEHIKKQLGDYQRKIIQDRNHSHRDDLFKRWIPMMKLNLDYNDSLVTTNTSVDIITDGKEKFKSLFEDIRNAKESVYACYFIIKDDEIGKAFINLLTEKAKEGVEVKLLMDAMGSKQMNVRKLREFKEAGGKYEFYFKPRIRYLFIRFNYRNHRKIAVIDSNIAYIGGFNVAREYVGLKKKFGYWRDTHLRIVGNAAKILTVRFMLDWRYAHNPDNPHVMHVKPEDIVQKSGDIPIQIVSSGPNSDREENKTAMMKMITQAKKRIYIQTPYLVPDQAMMESLLIAAKSGVEVNIMIPCMPDHPFVYRTTLLNAGELIKEGANIYIYENGFLHAKTLVVDGEAATAGSTNFDIRSFRLNFETNAYIYNASVAEAMEEIFLKDLHYCRKYTAEDRANISLGEKLLESISRLLTEIL